MRFAYMHRKKQVRHNKHQLNLLQKKSQIKFASSSYSGSDERCGDSCGWTRLPDGRVAVVLSDGMGKGETAAVESERAVNSVLSLLKAGMDPEMALQVLNLLWSMSNRKELFSTMDLALLEPVSRELVIYKIGAAPTVVVRAPRCRSDRQWPVVSHRTLSQSTGSEYMPGTGKGIRHSVRLDFVDSAPPARIEILTAPAMPMGVTEYSEISVVSTLAMPGDRIIMMSDGVADSKRNDPEMTWLRRLLTKIKSRNLQIVSDLIIREAALNYGDREKDDMTAVVFMI